MTAPLQYGTPPAGDPTAVMGRRTLAWIADLLIYVAIVAAGFASMAEYTDIPPGVLEEEACDLFEQQNPGAADACIAADGSIYLLDTGEAGIQTVLSLGWLAFFVVLQGLTGGSPGKLLFGLRVVDQYGAKCGLGKSLARTLMWIVDAAPWIIPLVGPIAAFTSSGHRRVGDLAAGTYVVASSSVGQPILTSNAPIPAGQPAWGAAPPTAPPPTAPPAAGQGWQTAPPRDGRWESPVADAEPDLDFRTLDVPETGERVDQEAPTVHADPDWSRAPDLDVTPPPAVQDLDERAEADAAAAGQAPPGAPEWEAPTLPEVEDPAAHWEPPTSPSADWSTSAPDEPAPATEPPPFAAPGADGPPTAPPAADAPEPPAAAPRYELPPPQWDAARGTYIQWEPNRQAWLQWDDGNQRWKPIDT